MMRMTVWCCCLCIMSIAFIYYSKSNLFVFSSASCVMSVLSAFLFNICIHSSSLKSVPEQCAFTDETRRFLLCESKLSITRPPESDLTYELVCLFDGLFYSILSKVFLTVEEIYFVTFSLKKSTDSLMVLNSFSRVPSRSSFVLSLP